MLLRKKDTPLHVAVLSGKMEAVKILLKETPALVEKKNAAEDTALHCAAYSGHIEIIRMLLDAKSNVVSQNSDGKTPLHLAIAKGNVEAVQLLLKAGLLTVQDKTGLTPLALAVLQKSQNLATELLNRYSPALAIVNNLGQTPIHLAAAHGDAAMLKILLTYPNDLNIQDKIGQTALHKAVHAGALEAVAVLLNAGIVPTLQDNDGETALHLACFKGKVQIIEALLNKCPELFTIANMQGEYPLHYVSVENKKVMQWLMLTYRGKIALMDVVLDETESLVDTSDFKIEIDCLSEADKISELALLTPLLTPAALSIALMQCRTLVSAARLLETLEKAHYTYQRAYTAICKQQAVPQDVQFLIERLIEKVILFYEAYVCVAGNFEMQSAIAQALGAFELTTFFTEQLRVFPEKMPELFMQHVKNRENCLIRQLAVIFKKNLSAEPWFKLLSSADQELVGQCFKVSPVGTPIPTQRFSSVVPLSPSRVTQNNHALPLLKEVQYKKTS